MKIIDFIIGALLVNAMPHLVFGQTKAHFLGLFGYKPSGNILYAVLQMLASVALYVYEYGIEELLNNGIFIGGLTVLVLYFIFGDFMVRFYKSKK